MLVLNFLTKFVPLLLKDAFHQKTDFQVLDGIHLPDGQPFATKFSNFFDLNYKTNIDVVRSVAPLEDLGSLGYYIKDELLDKPRESVTEEKWLKLQQVAINKVIKVDADDPPPMAGYLWFGNGNNVKSLALLCKENPFFAAALTAGSDDNGEYLELKSFSASDEELDGKYAGFMSKMVENNHFINVRFNTDMEVIQISYRDEDGKEVLAKEEEWNHYAGGAMYNGVYYASCIHATIHVFHYIMTTAIQESTKFNKSLHTWAMPYDENVAVKYLEVGLILIHPTIGDSLKKLKPFQNDPDGYTVTGVNGFGAATGSNAAMLKEMCVNWGHCKTVDDFIDGFLLSDLYNSPGGKEIAKKADILSEFSKQAALIKPYGDDLSAAMKEADEAAFETAEKNLKKFLSNCGEGVCDIDNISSWVQLMSVTGIMHGSTISYTRATLMEDVMKWRDLDGKTWNKSDVGIVNAFNTIQGMEVGRHVFTDAMPNSIKKKWDTKNIDPKIFGVMTKYDDLSQGLKEESKSKIRAMSEFREYGWILSDWCPDGFDGKQLTIATYI